MNARDQFIELVKAQDAIRLVWAHQPSGILNTSLRELDRELVKIMNQIGSQMGKDPSNN
jgi:hypothetical protein